MKTMSALQASVLTTIFAVSGCASTEYVAVTPECTPPSKPALPVIDKGALWERLGDAEYRKVESYINALWGYADEQGAILDELCGSPRQNENYGRDEHGQD